MQFALAGATTRQIAAMPQIKANHVTVARDIRIRLQEAADASPATAEYRLLHQARLSELIRAWWPRAKEDIHALDRVLKLMEREAKLLGLDLPVKQEVEVNAQQSGVSVIWRTGASDNPQLSDG